MSDQPADFVADELVEDGRGRPHANRCAANYCPCYQDGFVAGKEAMAEHLLQVAAEIRAGQRRHSDGDPHG